MKILTFVFRGIRMFFKGIFLIIAIPLVLQTISIIELEIMRAASLHLKIYQIQSLANRRMAHRGDRRFGFEIISHIQRETGWAPDWDGSMAAAVAMTKKYPDMKRKYMGVAVLGILDKDTNEECRRNLIQYLETVSGKDFDGLPPGGCDPVWCKYDNRVTEVSPETVQNVADWWTDRLMKNAEASVRYTENNYKYPPNPNLKNGESE